MTFIRSTLFHISFWCWMVLFGFAAPILISRRLAYWGCKVWVDGALFLLKICCGLRVSYEGLENLQDGPAVYASKHQSTLDTFALWKALDGPVFVMKKQLFYVPVYGWYLWRTNHIAIDRKAGKAALKSIAAQAEDRIATGRSIVIFPEGTRTKPGETVPYKSAGVSVLYRAAKRPLVPVALNTGLFWPKRQYTKKKGVARVVFQPPLEAGLKTDALMEALSEVIERESNALLVAPKGDASSSPDRL